MIEAGVRFGALIIGDEILSGKREDKHLAAVIERLSARGLELSWARMVGDDADLLTHQLKDTFASGDVVFSFGGIGATPDDRTRACAAAALDLSLAAHPDGVAELEAQFGPEASPQRIRMVEFPQGAAIIPNPVNRVPGFSIRHHHFVPGFPKMAWPMVEWVMDTHYAHLHQKGTRLERRMHVDGARESQVIPLLERLDSGHPEVRISCLPGSDLGHYQLELGVTGPRQHVDTVFGLLLSGVAELGFHPEELPPR